MVIPIIIDGTGPLSLLSVLNSWKVGVTSSTFNETIFIHDKAMHYASSELSPYCCMLQKMEHQTYMALQTKSFYRLNI